MDKYGLKKYFLRKHISDVEQFFKTYDLLKEVYSKFENLGDEIEQRHGRSIVEKCYQAIFDIEQYRLEIVCALFLEI